MPKIKYCQHPTRHITSNSIAKGGKAVSLKLSTFLMSQYDIADEWCHTSKILEMHPHLPLKMPRLPREIPHLHARDAIIYHWRCIISFRDAYPPQEIPRLPREMRRLHGNICMHLQNLGYVTLLKNSEYQFDFIKDKQMLMHVQKCMQQLIHFLLHI